jgi:hypothetical protein
MPGKRQLCGLPFVKAVLPILQGSLFKAYAVHMDSSDLILHMFYKLCSGNPGAFGNYIAQGILTLACRMVPTNRMPIRIQVMRR